MTKSEWLEYRAKVTGKSVEELREEMKARSKLADRSKSGFASLNDNQRKEVSKLGVAARKAKREKDV